jgi:gluconate 2-dehydrogenase gamma chain
VGKPGLDEKVPFSRRTLLRRAGAVGAAASLPSALLSPPAAAAPAAAVHYEAYTTLTPTQADTLQALIERFIPTDAIGPGAVGLGVGQFIDRALGGALAANRIDYDRGLAALDRYSRTTYGVPFKDASAANQDAMITLMQSNTLVFPTTVTSTTPTEGEITFNVDPRTFFSLVKEHVLQGAFGDPYWGGNKNGGGWKLMQIPGISLDVKAADQELGRTTYVSQYKNSTYEWDEFKRSK